MRGHNTLYTTLFPASVIIEAPRKGQRNMNRTERDKALACRYYYHAHIKRRRYDDCLLVLEKEFFITPTAIVQRLLEQQVFVKALVNEGVKEPKLKKEYPQFVW